MTVFLVPQIYNHITPLADNFFRVRKGFAHKDGYKYGILTRENKIILPVEYLDVTYFPNQAMFVAKMKYESSTLSLMFRTDGAQISKAFNRVEAANSNDSEKTYLITVRTTGNGEERKGLIDANGKTIIPDSYTDIEPIANTNLFFVYQHSKKGIVSDKKQIILDTIYEASQFSLDISNKKITVKTDSIIILIDLDEKGNFFEKNVFENIAMIGLSDSYSQKKRTIPFYIEQAPIGDFNTKFNFARTDLGPINLDGLIRKKDKVKLLNTIYMQIVDSDFYHSNFLRCIDKNARTLLYDYDENTLDSQYCFVDNFTEKYVRMNVGGEIWVAEDIIHSLVCPQLENKIPKRLFYHYQKENTICQGGKWGVIDSSGRKIIPPKYDFLQRYYNKIFIAETNKQFGVINSQDKILIPFEFDEILHLNNPKDSTKWLITPFCKVRKNNFWGVRDTFNSEMIPCQYGQISLKANKNKIYFLLQSNNLLGIMNFQQQILIPVLYQQIIFLNNTNKDSILYKFCLVQQNNLWGIIDTSNQLIISCEYNEIQFLPQEKENFFLVKKNGLCGIFDENGQKIIPIKYKEISFLGKNIFIAKTTNVFGYFSKNGELIFDGEGTNFKPFRNGFAAVYFEEMQKWNFINKNGRIISEEGFENVKNFSCNVAPVQKNGAWGVIDTMGNFLISPQFDTISEFFEEKASAKYKMGEKFGYINTVGKWIIKPQFEIAGDFKNEVAIVSKNGKKFGVINAQGKWVQRPKYQAITEFDKYKIAKIQSYKNYELKVGLMNKTGKQILKPKYKSISDFCEGMAVVSKNEKYGFIDSSGKEVYPLVLDSVSSFNEGMAKMKVKNKWTFVNKKMQILNQNFDFATNFHNGKALVCKDGISFFIDAMGNKISQDTIISPYLFDILWYDSVGIAREFGYRTQENGIIYSVLRKMFYVNSDMRPLFPFTNFYICFPFENEKSVVKMQDKNVGILRKNGSFEILPQTGNVEIPFSNNISHYRFNETFTLFDTKGNVLGNPKNFEIKKLNEQMYELRNILLGSSYLIIRNNSFSIFEK